MSYERAFIPGNARSLLDPRINGGETNPVVIQETALNLAETFENLATSTQLDPASARKALRQRDELLDVMASLG